MQTLSSSIYKPTNWVEPLDWAKIFDETRRVEVDVGCGKGSFLLWAAQTQPGTNFVGVDRLLRRLRKVDRKAQRLGLENVRLLRVEASYFVGFLVPAGSVTVYHIYFPDPWPKRRHHARRLISDEFVLSLHRTLLPGGSVHCATDDADYFQWIQRAFRQAERFEEGQPEILPEQAQTDFEREFLAAGANCYRGSWVKR